MGRRSVGGAVDATGGGPWPLPISPKLLGGWKDDNQAISAMPGMCF